MTRPSFCESRRVFPAYDPRDYFHDLLAKSGLHRRIVPYEELDHDIWAEDIEVWEITRAGGGGGETETKG
jgi:cation diffusion facilitator CzcD-associated flavoprotein CzcO